MVFLGTVHPLPVLPCLLEWGLNSEPNQSTTYIMSTVLCFFLFIRCGLINFVQAVLKTALLLPPLKFALLCFPAPTIVIHCPVNPVSLVFLPFHLSICKNVLQNYLPWSPKLYYPQSHIVILSYWHLPVLMIFICIFFYFPY
jgi:hypothetical protein